VSFSNGKVVSPPRHYRRDARKTRDALRGVEPISSLIPFVLDPARDDEDDYLLKLSIETRTRWLGFMEARTIPSSEPEDPIA
jgi:hypothetical protein